MATVPSSLIRVHGSTRVGALSIIVGGPELTTQAASLVPIDLLSPPVAITITTVLGADQYSRPGIWARTGDGTGDGIADILIGDDQENSGGKADSGAGYQFGS